MNVTHHARALTRRVFATRPPTRIDDRTRKTLAKIQHALTTQPIDHLHALTVGRLARFELILQRYEAWCLANPSEPAPKHMLAVANAWRRTGEFLAQLEQMVERGDRTPSLAEYLAERSRAGNGHTSPEPTAPPVVEGETAPADADAGDAPVVRETTDNQTAPRGAESETR